MKQLIRQGDDPVLKQVCEPVQPGEDVGPLMRLMEKACKRTRTGVGLAAPQVGVPKRLIFVLDSTSSTVRGRFLINPEVVLCSVNTHPAGAPVSGHPDLRKSYGPDYSVAVEGCLSYPDVFKRIRRAKAVTVRWEDERRRPRLAEFTGYAARIIQHEVDHLDGICLVGDPDFAGEPEGPPALPSKPGRSSGHTSSRASLMVAALLVGAAYGQTYDRR